MEHYNSLEQAIRASLSLATMMLDYRPVQAPVQESINLRMADASIMALLAETHQDTGGEG